MDEKKFQNKMAAYGVYSKKSYLFEAFSRNIGIFSPEEQRRLEQATVAIAGLGGVGGTHLMTLVRLGVGKFHLSDFDFFEPANINRQYGATLPSFGRSKLDVMCDQALSINPYLKIERFAEGVTADNVDEFLEGVDVFLDGLDFFSFDIRRILFKRAREKGVYVVTAGPLGFSAALLVFAPDKGMGFDEFFNVIDDMPPEEKHLAFAMGLAPRPTHIRYMDLSRVDFEEQAGPSTAIACQICSGMTAMEAVRIILHRNRLKPAPYYYQFDPYLRKYRKGRLWSGNRNPIQRLKIKAVGIILSRNKTKLRTSPPPMPSKVSINGEISEEGLDYVIAAGIQAPSGDNAQPWKFAKAKNSIQLFLDAEADDSFFNFRQAASIISCGAVLENMQIAASALGFQSCVSYAPGDQCLPIAVMDFHPGPGEQKLPAGSIWKRHTNRTMYQKRPISNDTIQDIRENMEDFPGANLQIVTERQKLTELGKILFQADQVRSECRALHEHLHKMIRHSDLEAKTARDGFHIKNLEAGLAGEIFLRFTRPWPTMNALNYLGASRMVAAHSYLGMKNCSGAGLLTVNGNRKSDFLTGGRALQRVWLTLSTHGVDLQPMTGITLFLLRLNQDEGSFSHSHRQLLESIRPGFQDIFPEADFSSESQIMLFRVGYGRAINCGTIRKHLKDMLVSPA